MKQLFSDMSRWLDARSTRQDYFLCFGLGLLNALAMPPVYCLPILMVTFPIVIRLLDKAPLSKQVFFKTFLFFFAFHVAGLYWISAALFVDIANNWWVLPFSLSGLPALMAFYPAIAAVLWHRIAWHGSARLIALVTLWALTEWVRGWAFTGFPWNLWGYTWVAFTPMLQTAALVGMYGLSILTLILACLPVFFSRNYQDRFSKVFCGAFIALMLVLAAWGAGRLEKPLPEAQTPFIVRIVQPNIKQELKWAPEIRRAHDRKLWAHTIQPGPATPNMVIWPETAATLFSTAEVHQMESLTQTLLAPETILAAGVMEVELDPETDKQQLFNRIGFYNARGQRLGSYDKTHLVPFGEFLPFEEYWPVRPVAFSGGSMARGTGIQTLHLENAPSLSGLICYEIIFPHETVLEKDRPQWILNITNDAWYGTTSGPYQHLAITRARAVEEGLPVVRAANTGISAVIDPMGRIVKKLPLNSEGVIDAALPSRLKPTFFAVYGNKIFFGMLAALWLMAWVWQRKRAATLPHVR